MSDHTPRPWTLQDATIITEAGEWEGYDVFGPGNAQGTHRDLIAHIYCVDDTCEANARLIAAAPEMYHALWILANWDFSKYCEPCELEAYQLNRKAAQDALDKAERRVKE